MVKQKASQGSIFSTLSLRKEFYSPYLGLILSVLLPSTKFLNIFSVISLLLHQLQRDKIYHQLTGQSLGPKQQPQRQYFRQHFKWKGKGYQTNILKIVNFDGRERVKGYCHYVQKNVWEKSMNRYPLLLRQWEREK